MATNDYKNAQIQFEKCVLLADANDRKVAEPSALVMNCIYDEKFD